jgi:BirA family biotin operon repressor/biotin-[acetyl-CoA-carboxylase] ligase
VDFTVHPFDEIGSTNDEAAARARIGAPAGTVITAQRQSAGRGRQGREWQSPVGNLYASVLLRPRTDVSCYGQLAFVLALALGEAIGSYGVNWALKWPNDVLVGGAKISGLLLESEPGWVVAGMGVNVAHAPDVPGRQTTSLHQAGAASATSAELLQRLLPRLAYWYESWEGQGFTPIHAAWLAHGYGLGQPVTVRLADGQERQGRFEALDADGALLLSQPGQPVQRILAGDVFFA